MRVLWTNHALDQPAGTETFTRDLTLALTNKGHSIEIFTSRPGRIASELTEAGIPVHNDPTTIDGHFDLIHGQHFTETAIALAATPNTPALFFCHAFPKNEWLEHPFTHPRLLRIVTTCENLGKRLQHDMQTDIGIGSVSNPFNPTLFDTVRTPPPQLRRALFFHNTMTRERPEWLAAENACKQSGITLDAVGSGFNNPHPNPEHLLPEYDLVFAGGRCAIEAIACGCAVITVSLYGCGTLATIDDSAALYHSNFTKTNQLNPYTHEIITRAIHSYQPEPVQSLTQHVRKFSSISHVTRSLEQEYTQLLNTPIPSHHPDQESLALASALHQSWQFMLLDKQSLQNKAKSADKLLKKFQHSEELRKTAEKKLKTTEKVLQRGWFRNHAWRAVQRHWEKIDQPPE